MLPLELLEEEAPELEAGVTFDEPEEDEVEELEAVDVEDALEEP